MKPEDLDRLEKLERQATHGPWHAGRMDMISYDGGTGPYKNVYCDDDRGGIHKPTGEPLPYTVARGEGDQAECRANARLIAETRNALPELLRLARIGMAAGHEPDDDEPVTDDWLREQGCAVAEDGQQKVNFVTAATHGAVTMLMAARIDTRTRGEFRQLRKLLRLDEHGVTDRQEPAGAPEPKATGE